jgi:transposase
LVATVARVDVWVGLGVGKGEHFADVLDIEGERLFARAVASDQADLEALLDRAARHGTPGLVIDQPGSIAQLVPAEAATGRVIAELAAELDRICGRRDALAAEIEEAFLAHPSGELLASMPGIGPRAGARIPAEIGGGSAFATGSKLAAYAGLAPVTRQSGTTLAGESRSRRGNHRLKNAMFLAAFAALRDPASKACYDRKRADGKRDNAALICLARRRCDVILAMLATGQHHQPARPAPGLPRAA